MLIKAAKRTIPAGRIPDARPGLPRDAARLADLRDAARTADPTDPQITDLNREIATKTRDYRKARWCEYLGKIDPRNGARRLWSAVRSLTNPRPPDNAAAICFNGTAVFDSKRICNKFCQQFTAHRPSRRRKQIRNILRTVRKRRKNSLVADTPAFTGDQVSAAIRAARASKAFGPDGLCPLILRHIGPLAAAFLATIFNLSLSTARIPAIWKIANIIPILKPGKEASNSASYRPISILCPTIKILEKLLLPTLIQHSTLCAHQHGFRANHSTTTATTEIITHISNGLNQKKPAYRTVLTALDLSSAFDTLNLDRLIEDIADSPLPPSVTAWLTAYLRGRQARVRFRDTCSRVRVYRAGVPQGGVLSPLLFNIAMAGAPPPPPGIRLVSYADDLTILATTDSIDRSTALTNVYLQQLSSFFNSRDLQLSTLKSTVTLFTADSKEYRLHPNVIVNNSQLPLNHNPKILGVVLDPKLSLAAHTTYAAQKARKRVSVLKALAGPNWGLDKDTLTTTYKAIGRSVISYAAPAWSSLPSDTGWSKLQVAQNMALRAITGCHAMSPVDHLHRETNILPVKRRNQMLANQFWLAAHLPDHPNNHLTAQPLPPRQIRSDLRTLANPAIAQLLPPGDAALDRATYKSGLTALHRRAIQDSIRGYAPNVVLGGWPPPVDRSEATLPRETRCTLAQLRSGYSCFTRAYMARIDPTYDATCSDCTLEEHTVNHLFSCPARPTTLVAEDLWNFPCEVAAFLRLPGPDTTN